MLLAFTRAVPASIHRCELTHLAREPIDYARAVEQHARYEEALIRAGCRVQRLPDAPDLPDSVFVEDTAVVFDDIAVIARPGAASRRGEPPAMAEALTPYRRLVFIEPPGTLDGGDVLVTPGRVFVGISGRTNAEGARQLASHIAASGYEVITVPVTGCLHLKSAVTLLVGHPFRGAAPGTAEATGTAKAEPYASARVGDRTRIHADTASGQTSLLINRDWVDARHFAGFELVDVDPAEPAAANVLRVGDYVICAEEHPQTRRRVEAHGLVTLSVPAAELAKAEGGVTCCSVIVTSA
jgi:dimethylargininase